MVRLSVNVNKVATLRNARGGDQPNVLDAVRTCLAAGAAGITVHPRADQRHITTADVREVGRELAPHREQVEYNIEGDPRSDWVELVLETKPHQATLVPERPGEVTSEAGWPEDTPVEALAGVIQRFQRVGIRVSLFVDPTESAVRWAQAMGADRVELYTEPFARAFAEGRGRESFRVYEQAAVAAHELGLGVNAGHDLDLENLALFRTLPHLQEVSIGHALISRALFHGLETVVREYLAILEG